MESQESHGVTGVAWSRMESYGVAWSRMESWPWLEQGARWQESHDLGMGVSRRRLDLEALEALDALEVELLEVGLLALEVCWTADWWTAVPGGRLALKALEAVEAEVLVGLVVELESHQERWRKLGGRFPLS